MKTSLRTLLASTLLFACGPAADTTEDPPTTTSSSGSAQVQGTVNGITLAAKSAVFFQQMDDQDKPNGIGTVVISDDPELCTHIKANALLKGMTQLTFELIKVDGSGAPVRTGEFLEDTSHTELRHADLMKYDQTCEAASVNHAQTGKATVTEWSAQEGGKAAGTFELRYVTDQKEEILTGSFNAVFCPPPAEGEVSCK